MKVVTKIFIIIDIFIILAFFTVYGPVKYPRMLWITTAMSTGSHHYLADIFYSKAMINNVMEENSLLEFNDITDVNSITINKTEETIYSSIYEEQVLKHGPEEDYKLVEFKYHDFNCYLAVIYDPTRIGIAYNDPINSGRILTDITKKWGAKVAINGGGYSWVTNYPNGLIVSDGEIVYAENYHKNYPTGAFNKDGVLVIGNLAAIDVKKKNIKYALSFGPALIINGVPVKIKGTGGSGQNPRTVMAQRKDGIVLFLVVNGYDQGLSWKGRGGVYLNDLLVILERYGAYNAINMDGGSSTTMIIDHKLINSPCEPVKDGQDYIKTAWIFK